MNCTLDFGRDSSTIRSADKDKISQVALPPILLNAPFFRIGAWPSTSLAIHEEDVQGAGKPLPDAIRTRAVCKRGSKHNAVLESGVAVAAGTD